VNIKYFSAIAKKKRKKERKKEKRKNSLVLQDNLRLGLARLAGLG